MGRGPCLKKDLMIWPLMTLLQNVWSSSIFLLTHLILPASKHPCFKGQRLWSWLWKIDWFPSKLIRKLVQTFLNKVGVVDKLSDHVNGDPEQSCGHVVRRWSWSGIRTHRRGQSSACLALRSKLSPATPRKEKQTRSRVPVLGCPPLRPRTVARDYVGLTGAVRVVRAQTRVTVLGREAAWLPTTWLFTAHRGRGFGTTSGRWIALTTHYHPTASRCYQVISPLSPDVSTCYHVDLRGDHSDGSFSLKLFKQSPVWQFVGGFLLSSQIKRLSAISFFIVIIFSLKRVGSFCSIFPILGLLFGCPVTGGFP